MTRLCACGHTRNAHQHYTHAGDTRCGLCDCGKYSPHWWRRLTRNWRNAAAIIADEQAAATTWHKPPAPASPPVPGNTPGAGEAEGGLPVPHDGLPAPGHKPTITIKFYDDGSSKIYDHRRRLRFTIRGEPAPPIDLSDEALARFLDDLH